MPSPEHNAEHAPRHRSPLAGPIAVNAVLLGALAMVTLQPAATAQSDEGGALANQRVRGSYLMVGGDLSTGSSNAIWITDTTNQQLVAIRWDNSRGRIEGLGFRDLRQDAGREENPGR